MKRILSVDDEESILKCIKRALGQKGYEVITSTNPLEALEIMKKENLDLVTLDVRMPRLNGLEVYQALKNSRKDTVPVLFLTAYPGTFTMDSEPMVKMWQTEFADGNTDILYKPFDLDLLIEKVEALIGPGEEA